MNRRKYELAQDAIRRGTWRADSVAGTLYSVKYSRFMVATNHQGYRIAGVWDATDRKVLTVFVHRVLWELAHGPLDEGLQINHLNGVKHDNRSLNLEAVTVAENIDHAHETGLWPGIVRNPGRNAQIRDMIESGHSHPEIARRLGIGHGTVSRVRQQMPDWTGPHRKDPNATEKRCWGCDQTKPLVEFRKSSSSPDGRTSQCLVCSRLKCRNEQRERRQRVGAGRPPRPGTRAVLTWDEVDVIRERLASGVKHIDIAVEFRIGEAAISAIATGRAWKPERRPAS